MDPKKLEFPYSSLLPGEGKDSEQVSAEGEGVSRNGSHSADRQSAYLDAETGSQTMRGQRWAGPHLDQASLALHTSRSLFKT